MAEAGGCFSLGFAYKIFDPKFRGNASSRLRRQRIAASLFASTILSALALISVLPIPLHEYSRARLMT
jgi:hypothetical protein